MNAMTTNQELSQTWGLT